MGAICKHELAPRSAVATHVPVLTSFGMGRAAGIFVRPNLRPDFVRTVLEQAALCQQVGNGQKRRFIADTPSQQKWANVDCAVNRLSFR